MNERERHNIEYLVLFGGLLTFLVLFVVFRFDRTMSRLLSGVGSLFYIMWGIIHHALEGRLTKLVALEYILFGSLVFFLLIVALGI